MGQQRTWTRHRNSKMKGHFHWLHDFGCPEWQSQAKTHRQGVEEEEGEEQEEEEHDEGDDVPLVVAPQHVLERLPGGGQPEERGGWPAGGINGGYQKGWNKSIFLVRMRRYFLTSGTIGVSCLVYSGSHSDKFLSQP